MRSERYDLWRALPSGRVVLAGRWALETSKSGEYRRSAFRYDREYLQADHGSLDPVALDYSAQGQEFEGSGIPPILDELLPGRWETAVMIRHWRAMRLPYSPRDLHDLLSFGRQVFSAGALAITPAGDPPPALTRGWHIKHLSELVATASQVDPNTANPGLEPEPEAIARLHAGSPVSGARPKALVYDAKGQYLAKFARADDPCSHVRVEYAGISLARQAGLPTPDARIETIAGGEVLLTRRFDITELGGRNHVLSANAMLKEPGSWEDCSFPSYEGIVDLIARHSSAVEHDLKQMFGQMLFNRAINNVDDHLRNFAFLQAGGRWRLTPAYDLVPDLALGKDHQLSWNYQYAPPTIAAAAAAAKAFRLTEREAESIADRLKGALAIWPEVFVRCGVSAADIAKIERVVTAPPAPSEGLSPN